MSRSRRLLVIPPRVVDVADAVVDVVPAADVVLPLFQAFRCLFPRRGISPLIRAPFHQTAASSYKPVALAVEVAVDSAVVAVASAVLRRSSGPATTLCR